MLCSVHTDDAGIEAWRAMLLAHNAALRAIDTELSRSGGIPLTWYDVLLEVKAAPEGRLRMQELADRVVLSRTRVSRLVDEMVAAGLVTKTKDQDDRRVNWAEITKEGAARLRQAAPTYLAGINTHFASHLTEEEKKTLAEALLRVHKAHQRLPLAPPPPKEPK